MIQEFRRDVGRYLTFLRDVKRNPTNYSPKIIEQYRKCLGLTVKILNKARKDYPELFSPRCRQTRLELF